MLSFATSFLPFVYVLLGQAKLIYSWIVHFHTSSLYNLKHVDTLIIIGPTITNSAASHLCTWLSCWSSSTTPTTWTLHLKQYSYSKGKKIAYTGKTTPDSNWIEGSSSMPSHPIFTIPHPVNQKAKDIKPIHNYTIGRDFHLNTINHLCAGPELTWQTDKFPTVGPRCPLGPALPAIPWERKTKALI